MADKSFITRLTDNLEMLETHINSDGGQINTLFKLTEINQTPVILHYAFVKFGVEEDTVSNNLSLMFDFFLSKLTETSQQQFSKFINYRGEMPVFSHQMSEFRESAMLHLNQKSPTIKANLTYSFSLIMAGIPDKLVEARVEMAEHTKSETASILFSYVQSYPSSK